MGVVKQKEQVIQTENYESDHDGGLGDKKST